MKPVSVIFLLLTVAALAALFLFLRPTETALATPELAITGNDSLQSIESPPPATYQITLSKGQRTQGPAIITARQGDEIALEFSSDSKAELHLHGYDLVLQLIPGEAARLQFTATHAGRFEYELHGHGSGHHALGAIEVLPQ